MKKMFLVAGLCCLFVVGVLAATSGLRFVLNVTGTGYIVKRAGDVSGNIKIPATFNSKPVVAIGTEAFNSTGLTSITIPNTVTDIGVWAFWGCTDLTHIIIPNSVTNIGERAFCGCIGLKSIVIPNSVTSIQLGAFQDCTGLASITIGNGVVFIGEYAFSGCTGILKVPASKEKQYKSMIPTDQHEQIVTY